jgi:ABC-type multidrug transport system fused ATPase/permease subunit
LIERYYDPSAGEINFDQTSLKEIDLKSLRESIGYVSQEPVLLIGTIKDNLKYGNKDATEKDIEQAIKRANAEFVYKLDKKLDTYVGTGSIINLSGG